MVREANTSNLKVEITLPTQQITTLTSLAVEWCYLLFGQLILCLHLVALKITPVTVYHPFLKGQRCYWLCCLVSDTNQQHLFCLTFRSDDVRVFEILQMGVSLIHRPIIVELHDYPINRGQWGESSA